MAAGIIALVVWAGLEVQFEASFARAGSVADTAWIMLRYFTVIANLLMAVILSGFAIGRPAFGAPTLLGGVTLAMLLVGVVYGLLLQGLLELSGGARLADTILHKVTPALALLFWLAFAPKGGLPRNAPWIWTILPLAYFVYALVRGHFEGMYAYPFMDVGKLGWPRTGLNGVVIAAIFVAVGHGVLWLDRRLARTAAAAL